MVMNAKFLISKNNERTEAYTTRQLWGYKNCLIKIHDHHNNRLIIDKDGLELKLDTNRVLKAALTKHELY